MDSLEQDLWVTTTAAGIESQVRASTASGLLIPHFLHGAELELLIAELNLRGISAESKKDVFGPRYLEACLR